MSDVIEQNFIIISGLKNEKDPEVIMSALEDLKPFNDNDIKKYQNTLSHQSFYDIANSCLRDVAKNLKSNLDYIKRFIRLIKEKNLNGGYENIIWFICSDNVKSDELTEVLEWMDDYRLVLIITNRLDRNTITNENAAELTKYLKSDGYKAIIGERFDKKELVLTILNNMNDEEHITTLLSNKQQLFSDLDVWNVVNNKGIKRTKNLAKLTEKIESENIIRNMICAMNPTDNPDIIAQTVMLKIKESAWVFATGAQEYFGKQRKNNIITKSDTGNSPDLLEL